MKTKSTSCTSLDNLSPQFIQDKIAQLRAVMLTELDDATLSRFLIARQFHIDKTQEMLMNYLKWRQDHGLDELPVPNGSTAPFLISLRKYHDFPDVNYNPNAQGVKQEFSKFAPYTGASCYHGFDRQHNPIAIERLGSMNVKKLAETCPPEVFMDFHIRNHEFLFNHLMKEASERSGSLVQKNTVIFDCTGMSFGQFHLPGLQLLKVLAEMNSAMYPERLGRLFVVNAPSFFTAAWTMIKRWLDKRILDKIFILGSDYQSVLLKYISPDNLPKFLGGACTCAHMDGGCCPSPSFNTGNLVIKKGNLLAYGYEVTLSKSHSSYQHEIHVAHKGTLDFRFQVSQPIAFKILVDGLIIYESFNASNSDTCAIDKGVYTLEWEAASPQGLSNPLSLSYSVNVKLETKVVIEPDLDSGIEISGNSQDFTFLKNPEWVDGQVFFDAVEYL